MGQALNDFMRNKVQRKSSQTSKKSDDGRSERGGSEAGSAYGGSTKGRDDDTKSRGGASNASLSKKYGVCEKVVIGKGATAVVKLAHKWDRSTERLYAVKVSFGLSRHVGKRGVNLRPLAEQEFRKRRKNETEKEYVKKLTSEFCISSTLHQYVVSFPSSPKTRADLRPSLFPFPPLPSSLASATTSSRRSTWSKTSKTTGAR